MEGVAPTEVALGLTGPQVLVGVGIAALVYYGAGSIFRSLNGSNNN